jgi:hypothetical protein
MAFEQGGIAVTRDLSLCRLIRKIAIFIRLLRRAKLGVLIVYPEPLGAENDQSICHIL